MLNMYTESLAIVIASPKNPEQTVKSVKQRVCSRHLAEGGWQAGRISRNVPSIMEQKSLQSHLLPCVLQTRIPSAKPRRTETILDLREGNGGGVSRFKRRR